MVRLPQGTGGAGGEPGEGPGAPLHDRCPKEGGPGGATPPAWDPRAIRQADLLPDVTQEPTEPGANGAQWGAGGRGPSGAAYAVMGLRARPRAAVGLQRPRGRGEARLARASCPCRVTVASVARHFSGQGHQSPRRLTGRKEAEPAPSRAQDREKHKPAEWPQASPCLSERPAEWAGLEGNGPARFSPTGTPPGPSGLRAPTSHKYHCEAVRLQEATEALGAGSLEPFTRLFAPHLGFLSNPEGQARLRRRRDWMPGSLARAGVQPSPLPGTCWAPAHPRSARGPSVPGLGLPERGLGAGLIPAVSPACR